VILLLLVVGMAMLVGTCKRKLDEFAANPEKAGAELVVRTHPDLDLVSQDDGAGEMTVRNNKTGETMTLSYQDVAEGRLTVTGPDGTTTQIGAGSVDQAPAWVPRLPNAQSAVSVFHSESGSQISGSLSFETASTLDEVEKFLEQAASDAGLSAGSSSSMSTSSSERRLLSFAGASKTLNATLMSSRGKPLTVQIAYTEEK
jgi:hypothetical protein